jgi:hypothetical protein
MADAPTRVRRAQGTVALALLVGAGVSVALGVYGRAHTPALKPLFLFGFSGMLQMKTWLATACLVFVLMQVFTASWMWGRLPGAHTRPEWLAPVHRWSGAIAFVVSIPVALHCLWSLGFDTTSWRVVLHGTAGCLFYGAYAAKMLGLRLRGTPGWFLPVAGGAVFALFVLTWLTSAAWFFSRSGLPLS